MRKERWKKVFGGNYEVSSFGRVRRLTGWSAGCLMKLHERGGYLRVSICLGGIGKAYSVHCLVAEAFIGPCPFGMKVNHKDLNKGNNVWTNLEYKTQKENIEHAIRNGKGGMGGKLSQRQKDRIKRLRRWGYSL